MLYLWIISSLVVIIHSTLLNIIILYQCLIIITFTNNLCQKLSIVDVITDDDLFTSLLLDKYF